MKQLLLLIWFICAFQYSFAEVDDSNVAHDLTSIVIRQKFEGSGLCEKMPEFDSSKVYYDSIVKGKEQLIIDAANDVNNYLDSVTYEYDFGKKGKTFKKGDRTIRQIVIKSHVKEMKNDKDQEFIFDMKPGLNLKTKGASDPCYNLFNDFAGGHRNSYSIQTTFICDVPIPVKVLNSDNSSHLNIDKNECLELQLGEYYEKGNTRIRYKVNGTDKWETIYKNVEIAQNKSIELRYQDIVGPYGSADFIANIGKIITIRVEKQLQDGTGRWTYNKDVECRFYSQGPDFDIVDIHRTACDTEPLSIKINIENVELFDIFIGDGSIYWNLIHDPNARDKDSINTGAPAFRLDKCKSTDVSNEFILYGTEKSINTSLLDYLNDTTKKATQGWWCIQLATLETSLQSFISTKKPFKLSPKPAPITAQQVPNPDSTASPTDPVIYLDIKDTTPYRLPYSIYAYDKLGSIQNSGEPICEFSLHKEGSEEGYGNLREKFNEEKPNYSFAITKSDYLKTYFSSWYNNQTDTIRSTLLLGEPNGNESAGDNWEPETYSETNVDYIYMLKKYDGEYTYIVNFKISKKNGTYSGGKFIKIKGDVASSLSNTCAGASSNDTYTFSITKKDNYNVELKLSRKKSNSSEEDNLTIYCTDPTVKFIAGNNGYYLTEKIEAENDGLILIDMKDLSTISVCNEHEIPLSLSDIGDINSRYYVANKDLIAIQDGGGSIKVLYNGISYEAYNNGIQRPTLTSVQDYDDGKGFTYVMGGKKYCRYYNPLSVDEMYSISNDKNSDKEIIGYEKAKEKIAWEKFVQERNSRWAEFQDDIFKKYYKITGIPKKDFLPKSIGNQKAYSGYIKIKDSDGCYSDTIPYTYKYNDFTIESEVTKYPETTVSENGEIKLTKIKGSDTPYTYKEDTIKVGMVISGLKYGDNPLTFASKTDSNILRTIRINLPFVCTPSPQKCKNGSGSITVTDTSRNPIAKFNSIIIENSENENISKDYRYNENIGKAIAVATGTYNVFVGENNTSKILIASDIKVEDKSFAINVENEDATTIGDNGSLKLKATNADKEITLKIGEKTISGVTWDTDKTSTISLRANTYTLTAIHDGCAVDTNITILEPTINFLKSESKSGDPEVPDVTISYNENSNKATITAEGKGGGNISEYELILKGGDKEVLKSNKTAAGTTKLNGTFKYSSSTKYNLYLRYKALQAKTYSEYNLTPNGIIPLSLSNCKAKSAEKNATRCYGERGVIELNGKCSFEINGESQESAVTTFETEESFNIVKLLKTEETTNNDCKISQTVTRTDTIQIVEIPRPEIDLWVKDVTCFGTNDGTIEIESASNIKNNTAKDLLLSLDKNDQGKSKLENLSANTEGNCYKVLIIDGSCTYTQNASVKGPNSKLGLEIIGKQDPTCTNDNGSIVVSPNGGWGNYIFSIDDNGPNIPGEFAEFEKDKTFISADSATKIHLFDMLGYGEHTLYVSDNKGCTEKEIVNLEQYQNPHVTKALFDSVSCSGLSDGKIKQIEYETDCKVEGAPIRLYYSKEDTMPSAANWQAFNPTISNLQATHYHIWLKDTNECVSDNPFYIKVEQPDSLILSITDENNIIREYGKPGGSVNVNVSGGNKGTFNIFLDTKKDTLAQVIWGNHAFNDIFRPGTHKLYVTDHKECIDSATTKQMRQPDSPLSIEATPHDALCNGSFGSITVRGSGGWNGYQYSCSSKSNLYGANQNEYTFHDIKGGYYEVSVTDAEGVTATQKVYVNTPPKLMAVPLLRASSCKNDGLISANITGGTMPYLVKPDSSSVTPFYFEPYITNSNLTIIPKQLAAGDYSIVVVDSNNCEILMSATIADSSVKATVKPVYPTAHEFANGRLEAVVQQGPAPYTYLWKNHNTSQTCTNAVWDKVGAGVYSLDVSDANNCSVSVPITYLATNGDLPLIIDTIIGETAVGACNGMARFTSDTTGFKSITLHGNSGVKKDVTSLVNNKLQFELTGLAPDSYLLECVLADTTVRYAKFTIARYEPMHLIVSNIVDVSKQDAANGSAKLRIDGGRAPFIVQMLRGDDFLADTVLNDRNLPMSGLTAANYTVSVVDESANRVNAQFIIRKPEKPLQLQAQTVENPSCNGYNNGRIILKATGGWGDYEYAAAEGEFGRATAYDGRGAAVHTFVAIDSKGITDTLKVELVEPLPLTARVVQVDSVSCFGRTDGSVTFDIAGGTAPYTVHYDDFFDKKSNFVGSLNAGTHTFSITDSNFCQTVEGSLAVDIPQPDSLQVAHDSVIHTTCNTDNGRIFITIAGGTAPYANSWREDGLIKERFANLTAIDSLQGYSLYEVEVADAKGCKAGKSYRINPSSGPKIERVRTLPVLCYGDSTGTAVIDSADIVPATPYSPFRIEWPHGENAMSVGNLPAGWNVVFIIDSNNCKNSTSFNIDAPSPIEIIKVGSRDASCYGYADGRISTLTLGGVGGYRYLWSNGDTLPDIDSIAKGAYTIVVADRNNCRDSAVFAIGQPDSLHVEIGEENVLMCPDNTYEFIPTDGFKTYRWILNDSTLSDKRNLIASEQGEYHLVATYGANCISRDTVTITIGDDLLEADFYMASDASKDNTIALVELSNMKTDSIRWDFSAADFEVVDSSLYELQLKPNTIGLYNITLWAYSSGCVSYITKQVEISDLPDTTDNIKLGYDPLIKSVTVKPNPTNGLFRVDVQLRESHDAEMTISSVSHGTQIEQRKLAGDAEYSESFDLSNASDGVYILRISASDEHRVLKVLIAK
ncbi:MAG: hypothetical protein MJ069_01770 [Salinivirgaceae bacterium]|nr:hypothetical protein [Salinivirgaceae bacterium]